MARYDTLEKVVQEEAPNSVATRILTSEGWKNLQHKKGCTGPKLVHLSVQQQPLAFQEHFFLQDSQQTGKEGRDLVQEPSVSSTAAREQQKQDEVGDLREHITKDHQQAFTFGRGSGNDYLGGSSESVMQQSGSTSNDAYMNAAFMQGGCACGAEVTVGGNSMHTLAAATAATSYQANMTSSATGNTPYLGQTRQSGAAGPSAASDMYVGAMVNTQTSSLGQYGAQSHIKKKDSYTP